MTARMLIATLAVAGVIASGCGGDNATTSAGADEETAAAETTTETTSAPNRVDLVTPPGDELVFEPDTATAAAGPLTLVWDNGSKLSHSLCLEDARGKDVDPPGCSNPVHATSAMPINITGTYDNLKPGEYTFYCDVDGHRAAGMEGTLTVE
jgi:plastocyanin